MAAENKPYATDDSTLDAAINEIAAKLQRGERLDLESYFDQFPEHADRLRKILPGMLALVELGHSDPMHDASTNVASIGRLGDFRIVRELGRGGMGVVYEAEQESLGRTVALKVLPFVAMLNPQQLQRFKNEAKAAATIHHPNIVPVYSVGVERGIHYYAMQFINGIGLDELIQTMRTTSSEDNHGRDRKAREQQPSQALCDTSPVALLSTQRTDELGEYCRSIARLGIQAADALNYAHQLGIVHRDVKPSNLLLDGDRVWITDFGLATNVADADLTMSGDLVGTLRYMSPEQAAGRQGVLDHRTDVYSLGATLHELVSLQPLFVSAERQELLQRIGQDEPAPLRKINPEIERDLETILAKATAKSPEARYQSARGLAEDLQRFIDGKPIAARRTSRLKRSWRWSKRNPATAAMAVTIGGLMLLLSTVGPLAAIRLHRLLKHTSSQNFVLSVAEAYESWEDGNLRQVRNLLEPYEATSEYPGFACQYLRNRQRRLALPDFVHPGGVASLGFSPDGNAHIAIHENGHSWIHDLSTGLDQHLTPNTASSKNNNHLSAFSRDGTKLAIAAGSKIEVWRVEDKSRLMTLDCDFGDVTAVQLSPGADSLAAGSSHSVVVWDVVNRSSSGGGKLYEHEDGVVTRLAFSPDGKWLASSSSDGTVHRFNRWEKKLVKPIRVLRSTNLPIAIAFSPDGNLLATGGNEITLWTTSDWRLHEHIDSGRNTIQALSFSHDSRMLGASASRLIKTFDVDTGREISTLRGHLDSVTQLAFSPYPSQATLISASSDGCVKLWAKKMWSPEGSSSTYARWLTGFRFTGDASRLMVSSSGIFSSPEGSHISILDLATGNQWRWLDGGQYGIHIKQARCPDNPNLFAFANESRGIEVWNTKSRTRLASLKYDGPRIWGLAISPDGQQVASSSFRGDSLEQSEDPIVQLWDISTKTPRTLGRFAALSLQFSPTGTCSSLLAEPRAKAWYVSSMSTPDRKCSKN